ncbi:Fic family protein [Bradyrhizobium quebecense]|uniref:Fic family protein n=2 Tax=Bradyrhizobium quebecense TaxID=2748629 RepID=A0ABS3ML58_9BRAD|nr:Fic family protein [Bradyrhizobium quebecense]UGY00123.1 Fic family protein [Bradyrhizobium quebecense]
MIVYELVNTESHPVYKALEVSNGNRQYDFLRSIVQASLDMGKPFLSQQLIKASNFHAITCLHAYAGEYRPCPVSVGQHIPPAHYRVPALMDDFVNTVNRSWDQTSDPIAMATYVLWRINNIHPFINGNGRTARATCYFVLCIAAGGLLPGTKILPELIRQNRQQYCDALQLGHDSFARGNLDLSALHALVSKLVAEQLQSSTAQPSPATTAASSPTAANPTVTQTGQAL